MIELGYRSFWAKVAAGRAQISRAIVKISIATDHRMLLLMYSNGPFNAKVKKYSNGPSIAVLGFSNRPSVSNL
jgi:hypothetical protein